MITATTVAIADDAMFENDDDGQSIDVLLLLILMMKNMLLYIVAVVTSSKGVVTISKPTNCSKGDISSTASLATLD